MEERPSAAEVRKEVQGAAQGMLVNTEDLALRQEMLKGYDTSCAGVLGDKNADAALKAHGHAHVYDSTDASTPSLSAAAACFKATHPTVIAEAYDERTSVHLYPATESSVNSKRFVWGGGAATCGRRGHDCMEDTHFCYHDLNIFGNGTRVFMFGVFDGHGGPGAAVHCSRVMPFEVCLFYFSFMTLLS